MGEIETLVKRYGVNGISFSEDNFFTDERRVRTICRGLIDRNLKIKWSTDARIDKVIKFSDDFLSLLKKAGCTKLYLGAESGDQEVLDLIDKRIRVEDTVRAAEILHNHYILAEFFLMVGFPLNPEKDLRKTTEMIRQIKQKFPNHQATPFIYTPYPGTKLFNSCLEKGLTPPDKLEGWINWNILTPNVAWVDSRYLDKVNRLIKFYFPFAYPSQSLSNAMHNKKTGFLYRMMHSIAKFRIEKDFFLFPLEWHVVKFFYYKVKLRFNVFKNISVPR